MNRNDSNRFAQVPRADVPRTRMKINQNVKMTFDAGKLVPFYVEEVLPGDTFSIDTPLVCRMTTPIFPVLDNCYLDYYYFFIPNRLTWRHWKEFMGENNSTQEPWVEPVEYSVPQVKFNNGALWPIPFNSVADYMGLPISNGFEVNALPFRAYVKLWNDWFRDQNNMTAAMNSDGDEDVSGVFSMEPDGLIAEADQNDLNTAYRGGALLPVSKFHDFFTSALPQPQKGDPIPLLGSDSFDIVSDGDFYFSNVLGAPYVSSLSVDKDTGKVVQGTVLEESAPPDNALEYGGGLKLEPNLTGTLQDINSLRYAFQVQRFMEKSARGGTRYTELLKSMFGVSSPDGRLQRSEYLGGHRVRLNMSQVVQTSSSDSVSPQGNTGAYSLTISNKSDFTKSFTEHGFVIGVLCVRTDHTYQQGLEKFWSRKEKFDYYFPTFAHIGEQPIYNKEIFMQSATLEEEEGSNFPQYKYNPENDEIFGYQEAWAEYRYKPNRVAGAFRSNYLRGSLDVWTYADNFVSLPVLGKEFISETKNNVQRTLAVQNEPQFLADILIKNVATRPMPLFSTPGLIDHM